MSNNKEAKTNKRNVPLILIGVVTFVLATILKANSIGLSVGVALDILQVIGIILILLGFGVSWTKKKD
jgi:hypothetical protein